MLIAGNSRCYSIDDKGTGSPFYEHGLTLISAWISNYLHYKVWGEITYPPPNFIGAAVEVWEWISYAIQNWVCDYLSMLGLQLIHVSKNGPLGDNISVSVCISTRNTGCVRGAPRWRHQMKTFSALLALCEGNPLVTGGFPSQRPVTRSFDVFFHLRLNKRLSKQSRRRWFETPSDSLLRHRDTNFLISVPADGLACNQVTAHVELNIQERLLNLIC